MVFQKHIKCGGHNGSGRVFELQLPGLPLIASFRSQRQEGSGAPWVPKGLCLEGNRVTLSFSCSSLSANFSSGRFAGIEVPEEAEPLGTCRGQAEILIVAC